MKNSSPGNSLGLCISIVLAAAGVCRAQVQSVTNAPVAAPNASVPTDYTVVQRDLNSRIWEGHSYRTNDAGIVFTNTHRYTELCTGMAYMQDGQLLDSVEEIDPIASAPTSKPVGTTSLAAICF